MLLSVHLLDTLAPDLLDSLHAQLSAEVRLTTGLELPPSADYRLLVAAMPERAHLTASPNLRAVIIPFTGVSEKTREVLLGFPQLAVHNCSFPAVSTAEGAVTLLLAAAKFIAPVDRAFREHNWESRYQPSPAVLLAGKTALILGYGDIGQHVARICCALGMKVFAIRRNPRAPAPTDIPVSVYPPSALHELLPLANILIVALPLTPETHGMIGAGELARLRPPAILVNVGRGPIVDEAALYDALRSGKLHAAGLDVWYNYPTDQASRTKTPPSQFPFHELRNVVMTPHSISSTSENEQRFVNELAAMLNTAARGEPMPNRVDVHAGY